jgi:uncharacterized membrane protein YgdD (TMEM256/DUF423 family)
MHRTYLKIAALTGAITVIMGAFGAHKLKQLVSADLVSTYQTGVTYQFYHTFALLAVGILYKRYQNKWMDWAGRLFILGTILFSGSLYLLTALQATRDIGLEGFGIITPFGGVLLVAGWLSFFLAIPSDRKKEYSDS